MTSVHNGEARQFTRGSKRDTSPRWSPDGRWLAFLSTRGNDLKPQLYVMPAGGGEASALTHLPGGASNIEWSPDSSRIAFLSSISDTSANADSREHSKSHPARIITTLRYKYNGESFIHDTHPHIFTVGISGGEPQQLTSGDWNAVAPRWSPDGARLAFLATRHADRDYDNAVDIWVMPSEGGEATRLTATAEAISSLAFSPDGGHIAYIGDRFPNDGGRHQRLFTLLSTGGTGRCLTDFLDRSFVPSNASLAWPAASALYGLIRTEGCVHIYRVATGSEPHTSAVTVGLRQVGDFSLSQNGQLIAFTASSAAAPAEVFLCRADGSDERQLTHCNDVWLGQVELMTHEEFHFERNNFTVQGWVMRPAGFQSGAGFAVVCVNPRGSQSYSEAFAHAVVGDWGGEDAADVLAGLETAPNRFDFLDPERIGVLGGSYGGFMTSWLVGHTDRSVPPAQSVPSTTSGR